MLPKGISGIFAARLDIIVDRQFYICAWKTIIEILDNPDMSVELGDNTETFGDTPKPTPTKDIHINDIKEEGKMEILEQLKAEIERKVEEELDKIKKDKNIDEKKVKRIKVDILRELVNNL